MGGAYLALAVPFSLLTRAWEANDELDHATYIEYIVAHGSLPRISAANGHESHQPPLYYLVAAAWQKLLGIPAFKPSATPNPAVATEPFGARFLELLHNYTHIQHTDAVYLHELRLLSVLFGLATVLLSYGCARLFLARPVAAVAVGLTVALLPKQLVVDSVVTNDNLVITLSVLALFVFLLSERARQEGKFSRRRWLMLALGTALGLAAITKYNSLPLAGLLMALSLLPAWRRPRLLLDSALAAVGFLAVSVWWFVRDQLLYGQVLATRASLTYLKAWIPSLVRPVSWTNAQRFVHFVPAHLFESVWYDGGWNQFILPRWMNAALWVLAALSTVSATVSLTAQRRRALLLRQPGTVPTLAVAGSVLAGLAAVLVIAQTTAQAEGRVGFVGLAGFAIILVLGTQLPPYPGRLATTMSFLWPAALAGVNIYVIANFLIPFRGL